MNEDDRLGVKEFSVGVVLMVGWYLSAMKNSLAIWVVTVISSADRP